MLCEYFRIIVKFGKTCLKAAFMHKLQHCRASHVFVFSGLVTLVHQGPRSRRVGTGCVGVILGAGAPFEAHVEVAGSAGTPRSTLHTAGSETRPERAALATAPDRRPVCQRPARDGVRGVRSGALASGTPSPTPRCGPRGSAWEPSKGPGDAELMMSYVVGGVAPGSR